MLCVPEDETLARHIRFPLLFHHHIIVSSHIPRAPLIITIITTITTIITIITIVIIVPVQSGATVTTSKKRCCTLSGI
ncbi:hypothetical protein EYF80_033685 [Liparis tanakae]|uniref:Uncharacterized protein n=1 Tax=Liparis tanakae TaxID=230148 RepID=A0A4Z2GSP1_9TELE|nr:hypothetical protein EYF80_033685 [Liparis tanakae]